MTRSLHVSTSFVFVATMATACASPKQQGAPESALSRTTASTGADSALWRTVGTSDSVTVAVDMNRVRPFREGTVLLQMRYQYRVPQDRPRAGREVASSVVDYRDPRGFPTISGDSVGATICAMRARGDIRPTGG